jgi:hypothetical protein
VILAAGLLVLLGLGLFVGGVLTGTTALYWACVAACVVAAVLLFLVRRQLGAPARTSGPGTAAPEADRAPAGPEEAAATGRETEPVASAAPAGATQEPAAPRAAEELPDPPVEDVEVTDLLLVVDLEDEVLVIDERPRYHVAGCVHVTGRPAIPLPLDEARTDGFTPCGVCRPDATLADRVRARKGAAGH